MAETGFNVIELQKRIEVLQDMLATYATTVHQVDQPVVLAHLKQEIAMLRDELEKQRRLDVGVAR